MPATTKLLSVVASAALLAGLSAGPSVAAAPTAPAPPSTASARYGAGWLARQITAGGGHLENFGFPDVTDTAYAVLGLHAAGVGRLQSTQAIAFLKTQLGTPLRNGDGSDNPGSLGYVILAAVAAGADPRHFGGTAAVNDLPGRLLATRRTAGADTGLFGTEDPTYDGAFRQGVALAALQAARVPATSVGPSLSWLQKQQCSNGLWQSYRSDVRTPCGPADPATFTGPETNSTSLAVQGLAAYGRHPKRGATVSSLNAVRGADGGFPFLAVPGQASDPNSTALSIQTLLAEGAKPGAAYAALASYQLGCTDPVGDRGAYFFPGDRTPNLFATVQAVPAAAGKTLPIAASTPSRAVPTVPC